MKEVEVHRLSLDAYKALEKAVGGAALPIITSQTTALQAAEAVGIQRVLKAIRDGFVVGA